MSGCACSIEIDHDVRTEFFSASDYTARKEHHCFECQRVIKIDENYRREAGKWDGFFAEYKTCTECIEIRDAFFCTSSFGTLLSDFRESIMDNGGSYSDECVLALSPKAREKVCDIIQEEWDEWGDDE